MKKIYNLLFFILIFVLLQGCNTMYHVSTVNLEVIEPASLYLPSEYTSIAVKYNNCNIQYKPETDNYFTNGKIHSDSINFDSIASEVYYEIFVESLHKQDFFDSIIQLAPTNYTGYSIIDTLLVNNNKLDSLYQDSKITTEQKVILFAKIAGPFPKLNSKSSKTKFIDPKLGLYSKQELKDIADSTNADALFSFDFYSSADGKAFYPGNHLGLGVEYVYTLSFWNIYDLRNLELRYFQPKSDTIVWRSSETNSRYAFKKLPPRQDAVLNAADIAGTKFAEYIVPHWIEVQRMYYNSGHVELKKTKKLVKENNWLEAAKIWKANVNNPNKQIAAKSKFNMGVVCEINGNFEAALDWVVQSYHTLIDKDNQEHYFNCKDYIKILSYRMLDKKKIDLQYNLTSQK